jgi:hypothetical protein
MLSWHKKWFHISIDGKYVFGRLSGVSDENIFNSNLEMEFSLSSLDISTKAGVFWIPGLIPLFPFSLSLDGVFDGFLQYQSSGGYLVRNYSNYEVWNDFPLTEASNGIDKGWFWKGQIIIPYQYHSELGFRWNYSYWDNLISIDPSGFSSSSGLFGVMSSNRNYLDISPFMKVSLLSQWNLLFGWNGQILADKKVLEPVHSVYTEIIYNSENYGIYISGNYSMYPFILVPSFSVGINYTLTEGVVLSFEGEDVLSFFTEDRIRIGSYIEAGGTFSLLTKISL